MAHLPLPTDCPTLLALLAPSSRAHETICVNVFLMMIEGPLVGSRYPMSPNQPNLIGRDKECTVVLGDPRCSRVHACVYRSEGLWWVEDRESSNGTFVNSQKIDTAQLVDSTMIVVGSTRFRFLLEEPSTAQPTEPGVPSPSIVMEEALRSENTGQFALPELKGIRSGEDIYQLFRVAYWLLSDLDGNAVINECLRQLRDRTKADVVGFLWLDDQGALRPQTVLPAERGAELKLDEVATQLISNQRHRIAIEQPSNIPHEVDSSFTHSYWVPLIDGDEVKGAIGISRYEGQFNRGHLDWTSSLGNLLVRALVRVRRQATLEQQHQRLKQSAGDTDELIGESPAMLDLKSRIRRVARAAGCVLIRGESGAGKELVARAVHRSSQRYDRPMLSVNCAAIPVDLMESQLFGHKKGAFTSADSDHIGFFQQADSGTLFLDEVGELTLEGQAKLLRILEGHPFLPVGGIHEVKVDVRVIAATNRDLREYVSEKKFREDLYYRLSVFELYVPPLRERGKDIEMLLRHFLDHFKRIHGRPDLDLSDEARQHLLSYQWPGNVRQMRNVIDSAIVMAEGKRIEVEDLALRGTSSDALDSLRIDHWEQRLIREALQRTEGNVPEAAKLLGISRATLYRKIDEYGIKK